MSFFFLFTSDFRGALDNYKSCIDTASAGCTHDSRNYLVTGSAYYTDELQYLEACTGQDISFSVSFLIMSFILLVNVLVVIPKLMVF